MLQYSKCRMSNSIHYHNKTKKTKIRIERGKKKMLGEHSLAFSIWYECVCSRCLTWFSSFNSFHIQKFRHTSSRTNKHEWKQKKTHTKIISKYVEFSIKNATQHIELLFRCCYSWENNSFFLKLCAAFKTSSVPLKTIQNIYRFVFFHFCQQYTHYTCIGEREVKSLIPL